MIFAICLLIWMMHCVGHAKVEHWETTEDEPYNIAQIYFHRPITYTWKILSDTFDLLYGSLWCCMDDKKAKEVANYE